jgi:hypothetical protein
MSEPEAEAIVEFFQQQVAQFRDPRVIIDVAFPGARLPAAMASHAREGKLAIHLTAELSPHLRMCPWADGGGFELVGAVESARIPAGAIIAVMDDATGETITTNPNLLKAPQ